MANFTANLHHTQKPSFPLLDNDLNMELVSPFPPLHPIVQEDFNQNFQSIMGFSIDNFMGFQMPDFPGKLWENIPPQSSNLSDQISTEIDTSGVQSSSKKRKVEDLTESSSRNSCSPVSGNQNLIRPKNNSGKSKRGKSKEKKTEDEEENKPKEVVHVRARRGQATDSHSLAERVRRGKINEKLKCLQDIVPGCYKAMGMAVMLDEIINYVQSLQNQVEFLSMKLAAASAFDDFNSQTDCIHNFQKAKAYEAQDVDRLLSSQGYDQVQIQAALACFQSTWPSI